MRSAGSGAPSWRARGRASGACGGWSRSCGGAGPGGRARKPDGSPRYEATYEINAALEISVPEFVQLVSHEVVPGHVTNFALAQGLYVQGKLGFEATVL